MGNRPSPTSTATVGAFQAKTHLSRLLEDVKEGAVVTITVRGIPVAKLVPAGAEVKLPVRRDVDAWLARLRDLRARARTGRQSAAELVRAGRRS